MARLMIPTRENAPVDSKPMLDMVQQATNQDQGDGGEKISLPRRPVDHSPAFPRAR